MVIELSWRWPFVRRHLCQLVEAVSGFAPVATGTHQTRVRTAYGLGFLVRHEVDGWIVQLDSGRQIKRTVEQFRNIGSNDVIPPDAEPKRAAEVEDDSSKAWAARSRYTPRGA